MALAFTACLCLSILVWTPTQTVHSALVAFWGFSDTPLFHVLVKTSAEGLRTMWSCLLPKWSYNSVPISVHQLLSYHLDETPGGSNGRNVFCLSVWVCADSPSWWGRIDCVNGPRLWWLELSHIQVDQTEERERHGVRSKAG